MLTDTTELTPIEEYKAERIVEKFEQARKQWETQKDDQQYRRESKKNGKILY